MTVLLDLDGTLITSFPPKRAPNVPPSMRTHHVGIGSKVRAGRAYSLALNARFSEKKTAQCQTSRTGPIA